MGFRAGYGYAYLARCECPGLKSELRVGTDRSQLDGEFERDLLIQVGRAVRGRILVLLESIDLRVDSGLGTEN